LSKKRKKKQKRKKDTGDSGKKLTKEIRRNKMILLVEISGGSTNGEKENTR